jgi:acyl-homoserine-lactone acylase
VGTGRAPAQGLRTTVAALCCALAVLAFGLAAAAAPAAKPKGNDGPRGGDKGKGGKSERVLEATIRRTKFGVPHIKAPDIESLAAGYAYAYAEDNICTIAAEYVTVAGKRSKYFGPDEEWYFSGNGSTFQNLDADVYFKWVQEQGTVRRLMNQPPPLGPKKGVRRGVKGYVAGYNAYLKDIGGPDGISDPACSGAPWVRKIKQKDAYRRFYQLGILASSGAVIDGIAGAEPVSPSAAAAGAAKREEMLASGEGLEALQPDIGSNAYGFGKEATDNGRGLVLGNPHFPWDGSERLYQAHLQIPGKVNVEGGSLNGVPLILIGWTKGLAWSHTVATAWRFTPFELTLPPGDPHSYIVDGEVKPMEATEVKVPLQGGGSHERTIYSTEYGPMIDSLVGIPLPWTEGTGFALRDVNAENFRYLNHFYDNNKAQSVREYDRIQSKYQGIPWVNSIAADSSGESYYSMQGAIPHVPDELAAQCNTLAPVYDTLGLPVLDGSRSECNWQTEGSGVAPGTFPPGDVPTLFRDDYVHNGNDSHWLTNPEAPMTGFDRIIGIENAERTYRTRIGLIQVEQRLAGTDGLPGDRFDRESLEQIALGNRQYLGELWRDELVTLCDAAPGGTLLGSSGPVDVSGACDVLRGWNLRDNLDSSGAILFRRFAANLLGNFTTIPTGLQGGTTPGSETLFTTPYSNSDPVHTPSGLNIANPLVSGALADAVSDLEGAGLALDSPLEGVQTEERGGEVISIHGGPGGLGVFNAISAVWDPGAGYDDVVHGSSFIMAAQFTDGRCGVEADTFVTYGQSENQASKHANDYTKAFSKKKWLSAPFCAKDVRRETLSKQRVKIEPRPAGRR